MSQLCKIDGCRGRIWVAKHGLCSKCYNRARYHGQIDIEARATRPLAARFWVNIRIGKAAECWPWIGRSRNQGYGSVYDNARRKHVLAHRVAWELTHGDIPPGEGAHGTVVMHHCDNRLCCNPAHLALGRQSDNVHDMNRKGRGKPPVCRIGEQHHNSTITEADVRAIRASSEGSYAVAERLGICATTVQRIRARKTWKHVT